VALSYEAILAAKSFFSVKNFGHVWHLPPLETLVAYGSERVNTVQKKRQQNVKTKHMPYNSSLLILVK